MAIRSHEEPSLQEMVKVVLRHRKKVLLFMASVVFLTAVAVVLLPRKYNSEAKLLVLVGRESVSLDPVVATGKTLNMQASRESEIITLTELLKSRVMISKVVDEIGAETILQPPENPGPLDHVKSAVVNTKKNIKETIKGWMEPSGGSSKLDGNASRREEAIKAINEYVGVGSKEGSTLISISAETHSPELSQSIVSSLVGLYTKEHMRLHSTAGSEDFFRTEKERIGNLLEEKRTRLNSLRTELGIGTVEAEYKRLEDEKASVAALRSQLKRELAGTIAKRDKLKEAVDAADEVVLTQRNEGMPNAATDGIRQKLYDLEVTEGKASMQYKDDHPSLMAIRAQLAEMRDRFKQEQTDRTELHYGRNLSRDTLGLELEQQQSQLADLQSQLQVVDSQWDSLLKEMESLNLSANQLDQLTQDVAFLTRSYDTYSDSLEQSRIGHSLTKQQISNVNIAQPATFQGEPMDSKRMLLALGGLLASILGAIPFAFVMEYLDNDLKSPAEVEAVTGVPVLAAMPRESRPLQISKLAKSASYVR
ncbi:Chain length determinant protein [Planctomycetes bacterium CA13]|uniref:Chain length determinant protein n=1 Tax=Novipirellula herctigrandis TaxID=2527986 RepID=A0A5C5Z4K7_9BACT|nr:Chain length determinant protein [Planctomycetes bacterium CA13]